MGSNPEESSLVFPVGSMMRNRLVPRFVCEEFDYRRRFSVCIISQFLDCLILLNSCWRVVIDTIVLELVGDLSIRFSILFRFVDLVPVISDTLRIFCLQCLNQVGSVICFLIYWFFRSYCS